MRNKIDKRHLHVGLHTSNFRNPHKILKAAEIKSGQKVVLVGCDPGWFTIPAAEIGKVF